MLLKAADPGKVAPVVRKIAQTGLDAKNTDGYLAISFEEECPLHGGMQTV
ncbi:MAG: hypothetical protein Q7T86_18475 [Hyphomicrobiaceae bacterium]|jgi:hypothetical protein|nr:hypothetical protein [Hyphomicrobiaceae bacterium]